MIAMLAGKDRTGDWIFYGVYEQAGNGVNILNYSKCGPTRSLDQAPIFTIE